MKYVLSVFLIFLFQAPIVSASNCVKELTELRALFETGSEVFDNLAKSLLTNTHETRFDASNPKVNVGPIVLPDLQKIRTEVARLLQQNQKTIELMSIFDMHSEGLHSLVLHSSPQVMVRIYVIPPGKLHPSHIDWSLPSLYHSHRYHFLSVPIEGSLKNERVLVSEGDNGWHRYTFESPVFNNGVPELRRTGSASTRSLGYEKLSRGQAYFMEAPEIHRVGFIPNPETGWAVILFFEFRDQAPSPYAYSNHNLQSMAEFGNLYNKPKPAQLQELSRELIRVLLN